MMFKTKRVLGPYDIPIASLQPKPVSSHDVVQVTDMSAGIAGNGEAAITNILTLPLGSGVVGHEYRLHAKNVYGEIDLTDEIYNDRSTGMSVPLWYVHSVKRPYYNSTLINRTIRRKIRSGKEDSDRIVQGLVPSNSRSIVVFGSVSVQNMDTSAYLTFDQFCVDYDAGTVTIRSDLSIADTTYLVVYDFITEDLIVEAPSGSYWRLEIERVEPNVDTYFNLRILSSDSRPVKVQYNSYGDEEAIKVYTEYTFSNLMFNAVPESFRVSIVADETYDATLRRVFSYETVGSNHYIQTYSSNPDRLFRFRSHASMASKVRLVKPEKHQFSDEWYVGVSIGEFTGSSARQFSIEEREGIDDYEEVTETVTIVDGTTLLLGRQNVIFHITENHEVGGITLTKKDNTSVSIDSVDGQRGILYLTENVSIKDRIVANYRVRPGVRPVELVSLNPVLPRSDDIDVKNTAFIFFLGEPGSVTSGELPVFIKQMPLYSGLSFETYTRDSIETAVNDTDSLNRQAYRSGIIGLPSGLVASADRLEVLGFAYLSNPLDEDGYLVEDARIRGGGTPLRHRSFYDYSYFDGEAVDLEAVVRVHIPVSIVDDLVTRAAEWDANIALLSDATTRNEMARQRVNELIARKVKKFSMLGTKQEIVIDE